MPDNQVKKIDAISPSDWLSLLGDLANESDEVSRHYFQSASLKVEEKLDATPVSEADVEIERIVRRSLLKVYPDLGVIGEEFESCDPALDYKLIIDPIDGTSNFIRGIPIYGTLMAIEKYGEIIAAIISNGSTNERWWASKGNGAYYNGKQLSVSKISNISDSQAFFGSLYGNEARGDLKKLMHFLSYSKRQRGIGDYLMHAWVASGYGEFAIDFDLKPWDLAPLGILVEESGGTVTQVDGSPFSIYKGSILSSNSQFHDQLVKNYSYSH